MNTLEEKLLEFWQRARRLGIPPWQRMAMIDAAQGVVPELPETDPEAELLEEKLDALRTAFE